LEPLKGNTVMLIGERFPGKRVDFIMKQAKAMLDYDSSSKLIVLHDKEETDLDKNGNYVLKNTYFLNLSRGKFNRLFSTIYALRSPFLFLRSLGRQYYPMNLTLKHYLTYLNIKKLNLKIDILHCHFGQIGLIGSFLKKEGLCEKLIVSFYGGDLTGYVDQYGKNIYKDTFENADRFIVCTEFLKKRLIEIGCDSSKISLIYLPQDERFFKPLVKKRKKSSINLLTVARLVPEKGIQNSLKAVQILSRKYKTLKYVLVGDGPYRAKLTKLVEEYGLEKIVEFKGVLGGFDALKEYQNADIFVLPSISTHNGWVEGGGLVNLEAQLCGLPVVASNCGGIPEYVSDGIAGFLVKENAESLAEKIEILINNPDLRIKMGKSGRKNTIEKYGFNNLKKLIEVYKSLKEKV